MTTTRITALFLLIIGVAVGYFSIYHQAWPFRLGLDLSGGSHLVYQADTTKINPADVNDAMTSLKEVIERRINVFGVAEPIIQVEQVGLGTGAAHRLIVELPGVTDLAEATKRISATPLLEFKTERPAGPIKDALIAKYKESASLRAAGKEIPEGFLPNEDPLYLPTELDGRYLKRASVDFGQQALSPGIAIEFNAEGAALFAKITRENVGKPLAIYLDGVPISEPVVREEIRDGKAQITGQFTLDQAKQLTRDLNLGALPVPIKLISSETVGATLGAEALKQGLGAGMIGFLVIIIFMILWYRVPGVVASVALSIYIGLMLAIFKVIPVTLTAAGIAGFILSVGMAVDANILIFERMKEELKKGKALPDAMHDGFSRAWLSIRDSNFSSMISAVILYWFGTSLIRGFALTLAIGVLVSMLTAITMTRTFLFSLGVRRSGPITRFLFGSGLN